MAMPYDDTSWSTSAAPYAVQPPPGLGRRRRVPGAPVDPNAPTDAASSGWTDPTPASNTQYDAAGQPLARRLPRVMVPNGPPPSVGAAQTPQYDPGMTPAASALKEKYDAQRRQSTDAYRVDQQATNRARMSDPNWVPGTGYVSPERRAQIASPEFQRAGDERLNTDAINYLAKTKLPQALAAQGQLTATVNDYPPGLASVRGASQPVAPTETNSYIRGTDQDTADARQRLATVQNITDGGPPSLGRDPGLAGRIGTARAGMDRLDAQRNAPPQGTDTADAIRGRLNMLNSKLTTQNDQWLANNPPSAMWKGNPDSPNFVGPPDPNRVSNPGNPNSPTFVGPPAPPSTPPTNRAASVMQPPPGLTSRQPAPIHAAQVLADQANLRNMSIPQYERFQQQQKLGDASAASIAQGNPLENAKIQTLTSAAETNQKRGNLYDATAEAKRNPAIHTPTVTKGETVEFASRVRTLHDDLRHVQTQIERLDPKTDGDKIKELQKTEADLLKERNGVLKGGVKGAATQPATDHSQADLEHTAKIHGITVDEVKRRLAAKAQ